MHRLHGRQLLDRTVELGKLGHPANNFGGLIEDAAVVLPRRALNVALAEGVAGEQPGPWGEKHMIPPDLARAARMRKAQIDVDEE